MAKKTEERELTVVEDSGPIAACMQAHGIEPRFVGGSAVRDDGTVVLVTVGGEKIEWAPGQPVREIDPIRITGVNPAAKKRKPITGTGK